MLDNYSLNRGWGGRGAEITDERRKTREWIASTHQQRGIVLPISDVVEVGRNSILTRASGERHGSGKNPRPDKRPGISRPSRRGQSSVTCVERPIHYPLNVKKGISGVKVADLNATGADISLRCNIVARTYEAAGE